MELPPSRLFKYFKVSGEYESHSRQLLTDCTIYYSSPADFNDPFDCAAVFSSAGTEAQWIKNAKKYLRNQKVKLTPMKHMETARRLAKAGRREENLKTVAARVTANWRVRCLSARSDDLLMWSHYADKHRGYVIEFNSELGCMPFCSAQHVDYKSEYKQVEFERDGQTFLEEIMLTKSDHWNYEAEYRLINTPSEPQLVNFDASSMVGVYFGCKTSEADKQKIREFVSRGLCRPKFYQFKKSETHYRLDLHHLD